MAAEPLRCPFLASASAHRYRVLPQDAGEGRPLFTGAESFATALLAAHGPGGALPLATTSNVAAAEAAGCPYAAAMRAQAARAAEAAPAVPTGGVQTLPPLARRLARCPLATISFPRPGGPLMPPGAPKGPALGLRGWTGGSLPPPPPPGAGDKHTPAPEARPTAPQPTADGAAGGTSCPMRRVPGFSSVLDALVAWDPSRVHLVCPPAIVAARAALARTAPVRALRPQPLSARFLAVAAVSAACNAPLGVWRAHTRKFSPQWILAVHASVPFIAMLRKALLMPPHAVLVTVLAAIIGQATGARFEKARLLASAHAAVLAADAAEAAAAAAAKQRGWFGGGRSVSTADAAAAVACRPLIAGMSAPRGLAMAVR